MTIEEIVAAFSGIPTADSNRWFLDTLKPNRLHLSRGPAGEHAIFLEGARESFGVIPPISGIDHSASIIALPSAQSLSALRLLSAEPLVGSRVIAHIAYELNRALAADPTIHNDSLLSGINWLLALIGRTEGILSIERQRGLVGECILLRLLLLRAHARGIGPQAVLQRWWGHRPSLRDFAAAGIAVEVKTTSHTTRQHHIQSIEQLDPQSDGEEVYLFSVGIRTDPTAVRKLTHFVKDVEALLVTTAGIRDDAAAATFRDQLRAYGYNEDHADYYNASDGFLRPHLEPALFSESTLDRLRRSSFSDGALPSMVVGITYLLEVRAEPLAPGTVEEVLDKLLSAPPVSAS